MQYIYAISMITENNLRVLQRISGIFSNNRLNLEQLNVYAVKDQKISHFSIVVYSDAKTVDRVIKQLDRLVELFEVKINSRIPLINNETRGVLCPSCNLDQQRKM